MNSLYLCDANYPYEDVPAIEINSAKDINEIVSYWMEGKKWSRIFVCFDTWKGQKEDHQFHFVVTQIKSEVKEYIRGCVFILSRAHRGEISFNIYEFILWEEAFEFCSDLQEGM